jgi:hypothetical protein
MATLSGGLEAGREPCAAVEQVAEGVEFADAPFGGGGSMPLLVSCELSFRELTSVVHDAGYASVDRVI